MAKDRYTEERDKQEAAKRAEIKALQEKVVKEASKMTEPPKPTEEDLKKMHIRPLRKKDDTTHINDGSNDSVVSGGIRIYDEDGQIIDEP